MTVEQWIWIAIPAISAILYSLLFLTRRQGYGQVGNWFKAFLAAGILWSVGSVWLHADPGWVDAIWLSRLSALGSISIPWLLFGFTSALLSVRRQQSWFTLSVASYIAVVVLNFTDLVLESTSVRHGLVNNQFGVGVGLVAVFWFAYFFATAFLLLRELRRARDLAFRNRLKYLLVVMALLLAGELTNASSQLQAYPIDQALAATAAVLISLSLSRYQLLEVKLAISRLFVLLLVAILYIAVVTVALYVLGAVDRRWLLPLSFLTAIATAALIIGYRPARQSISNFIDRVVFPQQYTLHALIYAVSQVSNRLRAPADLGRDLLDSLARALRFESASLLLRDDGLSVYRSVASLGLDENGQAAGFQADSPLVRELAGRDQAILIDELRELPRLRALWIEEWRALDRLQAQVLVSVRSAQDLIGFFVLGRRTGGEPYTREELTVTLPLLANQVSISLWNSRLYTQELARANQLAAANAELRQAEARIQASLREKDVLLKEIHHRVKNNLQIISSLLDLQSDRIRDPEAVSAFVDSRNRVRSMALIHDRLYRSQNLARVDADDYIRELTQSLFDTYNSRSQSITLDAGADDIPLNVDTAIPCGLIINELVTNALKHGFPAGFCQDGSQCRISVSLRRCMAPEGVAGSSGSPVPGADAPLLRLIVSDNGVGLPPDVDYQDAHTLGLQLVYFLTRQLEGSLRVDRTSGTTFTLLFARYG